MNLPDAQFQQLIASAPLAAVDLVVTDVTGRMLMGRRRNRPAQGSWFVPGGRIHRGETLAQAFARIGAAELGVSVSIGQARLLGAFTHLYDDNFFGIEGLGTHYVVLAYRLKVAGDALPACDDQHSAMAWITSAAIPDDVHPYARAYFDCLD